MRLWKRITIYIVALVLVVSCLVSPAAATDITSANVIQNLMADDDYYVGTLISGNSFNSWRNIGVCKQVTSCSYAWVHGYEVRFDEVYLTVYATRDFTLEVSSYEHTLPVEKTGKVDNFHYFKIDPYYLSGSIQLNFTFSSPYTGNLDLVSCYGVRDDSVMVTSATLVNQRLVYFPDTDEFTRLPFETLHKTLPFSSVTKSEFVNQLVDPLLGGYFFLRFEGSVLPFNYADSVTYVLATCGSADYAADSAHFACVLLDSSGNAITTLPVTYYPSGTFEGTGKYFGDDGMKWPLYLYTVVADTSGYDLSDKMISLQYQVDPVYVEAVDGYTGYMSEVRAIAVTPTIDTVPWYARFGNWINTGFNNVVTGLQSGFNSVVSNLKSGFKSVTDTLKELFDSEASKQLEQTSDDMKQSASDIGAASDSLGAVAQPDINAEDLIGDYTDFNSNGLRVLTCLTSNVMVTDMLIVVFTFCLAGYIFFGKKG